MYGDKTAQFIEEKTEQNFSFCTREASQFQQEDDDGHCCQAEAVALQSPLLRGTKIWNGNDTCRFSCHRNKPVLIFIHSLNQPQT